MHSNAVIFKIKYCTIYYKISLLYQTDNIKEFYFWDTKYNFIALLWLLRKIFSTWDLLYEAERFTGNILKVILCMNSFFFNSFCYVLKPIKQEYPKIVWYKCIRDFSVNECFEEIFLVIMTSCPDQKTIFCWYISSYIAGISAMKRYFGMMAVYITFKTIICK